MIHYIQMLLRDIHKVPYNIKREKRCAVFCVGGVENGGEKRESVRATPLVTWLSPSLSLSGFSRPLSVPAHRVIIHVLYKVLYFIFDGWVFLPTHDTYHVHDTPRALPATRRTRRLHRMRLQKNKWLLAAPLILSCCCGCCCCRFCQ